MNFLPVCFSLLIGLAGWYYMFHTHAADRLLKIEGEALNRRRIRRRRIGGAAMFLLAIAFYAGFDVYEPRRDPGKFIFSWVSVLILLVTILWLGLSDLRMTMKLKEHTRDPDE